MPLDKAAVRREGADVTILGWLLMLHYALGAAGNSPARAPAPR